MGEREEEVEHLDSAATKELRLSNEGILSTSDKHYMLSNEKVMGDPKRFRLEDFSLLTTIGTGTFARVCLCQEEHTRDYFALKVILSNRSKMTRHRTNRCQRKSYNKAKHSCVILHLKEEESGSA